MYHPSIWRIPTLRIRSSRLSRKPADATHVVLEVTESAAMKDLPNTLRIMDQLRVLGMRFSIDEFGTGYSSLAHLRRLPVDEIKIDRSFIQELEKQTADDVILRSTIDLGHAMNLKVVAEGVEVISSWDTLGRLGCDFVRGYFVSKPLTAADRITLMNNRDTNLKLFAAPPRLKSSPGSKDNSWMNGRSNRGHEIAQRPWAEPAGAAGTSKTVYSGIQQSLH